MTETYDKINHWYGWNGGECPVHPETEVFAIVRDFQMGALWGDAKKLEWSHSQDSGDIITFRVTRLYVEPKRPREFWIVFYDGSSIVDRAYCSHAAALVAADDKGEIIHVREVPEPTQ